MEVRILGSEYADKIYDLEKKCFSRPWSKENILSETEKKDSLFLGMISDGELIGYLGINIILDEGYLLNVAVDQKYRKRGVATELFSELFDTALKKNMAFITLEVRSENHEAISLYRKLGFEEVGRRKNYYSGPSDDALLMTKKLR